MPGTRTIEARKAIVRYIHEQGMRCGDRLPSVSEFRKVLGYGNTTLAAAIGQLCADGILEVRDRIGSFLVDPMADGRTGRLIGLVSTTVHESVFNCCLNTLISYNALNIGWQVRPFYTLFENPHRPGINNVDLSLVPGLERKIRNHDLDGIIVSFYPDHDIVDLCRQNHVAILCVGLWPAKMSIPYVYLDGESFVVEAFASLKYLGCNHIGLVTNSFLKEGYNHVLSPLSPYSLVHQYTINLGKNVKEIAQEIADTPADERPDGLVCLDDVHTNHLAAELIKLGLTTIKLAILGNNSNILYNSLPTVEYEIDMIQLSRLCIDMLNRQLNNPTLPPERLSYHIPRKN